MKALDNIFYFAWLQVLSMGSLFSHFILSLALRRGSFWLFNIKALDILMLFVLGLFTAILFEKWALKTGTWNYTEQMPVIFGIGLLPMLQRAILSIVTVYAVRYLGRSKRNAT